MKIVFECVLTCGRRTRRLFKVVDYEGETLFGEATFDQCTRYMDVLTEKRIQARARGPHHHWAASFA